ncbi:MAG: cupin domain-containing protein [Candidatus Pacebacteria bacterium]|nr:cupin domain-containing protein [Candidatus Paceibacterota bacterium]
MTDPKHKKGFHIKLEAETKNNSDFRRVLYTNEQIQLVLMSLKPGEEIGLETHPENDQFFRFDAGNGKVVINSNAYDVTDGDAIIVPRGAEHNIVNASETKDLKFYTLYAPAHHKDGVVRHTREEAIDPANDEDFDGVTSE